MDDYYSLVKPARCYCAPMTHLTGEAVATVLCSRFRARKVDEYKNLIKYILINYAPKIPLTEVLGHWVVFAVLLGRAVERKFISYNCVPGCYLGFHALKMDEQVVFVLQQDVNETVSDVAEDVHSCLIRIDLKSISVTLKKGILTVHYSSSEKVLHASMKLLGEVTLSNRWM